MTGAGISVVTVDSASTDGFVNKLSPIPAFTISQGALFEFEKIQIGIFIGFDFVALTENKKWDYQGIPWLSVGVGYQIYSASVNVNQPKVQINR